MNSNLRTMEDSNVRKCPCVFDDSLHTRQCQRFEALCSREKKNQKNTHQNITQSLADFCKREEWRVLAR